MGTFQEISAHSIKGRRRQKIFVTLDGFFPLRLDPPPPLTLTEIFQNNSHNGYFDSIEPPPKLLKHDNLEHVFSHFRNVYCRSRPNKEIVTKKYFYRISFDPPTP